MSKKREYALKQKTSTKTTISPAVAKIVYKYYMAIDSLYNVLSTWFLTHAMNWMYIVLHLVFMK